MCRILLSIVVPLGLSACFGSEEGPPPAEPVVAAPAEPPPPPPPPPPSKRIEPTFVSHIGPIPAQMRAKMTGVTWKEGCPVHLDELSLVEVSHRDFDGQIQNGLLIVASKHADDMVKVFGKLFEANFPIAQMRPAHEYDGDDDKSMAANNTSAFNCRKKTGGNSFSEHSHGHAIDINTIQNPYVRGSKVLPPSGKDYVERKAGEPGLIVKGDVVVTAFSDIGWKWGGNWKSLKDYQHFSATGK